MPFRRWDLLFCSPDGDRTRNKLSDARFNYLLYLKGGDIEQLKDNIKKSGYSLNEIGKGYEIIKEGFLIKKYQLFFENYKNKLDK